MPLKANALLTLIGNVTTNSLNNTAIMNSPKMNISITLNDFRERVIERIYMTSITTPRRANAFEKIKLRHELKRLQKEERKFVLACKDESNNEAMDAFCLRGLTKIRNRIHEINSMI